MSDSPITNVLLGTLNPLGIAGGAPFQAAATQQGLDAYAQRGLTKPGETGGAPTPPSVEDPNVRRAQDSERAAQRLSAGRASTVNTRTGLGDVNLFRRSLLGQ